MKVITRRRARYCSLGVTLLFGKVRATELDEYEDEHDGEDDDEDENEGEGDLHPGCEALESDLNSPSTSLESDPTLVGCRL